MITAQWEFLQDVMHLIASIQDAGLIATGGDLWRNSDKLTCPLCQGKVDLQEMYVASGRSSTLKSLHLLRLAIDLNFFLPLEDGGVLLISSPQDIYTHIEPIGDAWESFNPLNRWGGRFRDYGHFERRQDG